MTQVGSTCRLQFNELEELRSKTYENARMYKARTKAFHDKHINRKTFEPNQKVWLSNAKLWLFPSKLRSRWDGPFIITIVFSHGVIEIQNQTNGNTFKVNGQKLKHFVKNIVDGQMIESINLQWARLHLATDIELSAYWEATQCCWICWKFWANIYAITSPQVCSFQV